MNKSRDSKVIDPLYGEISLRKAFELQSLVKTPELQRLREIRVCNVSFYYMIGCSGFSRFEHSIGVAHLAREVTKNLPLKGNEVRNLIIASLLHDIGMPPFSHTTEKVLKSFFDFDHEENTIEILDGKLSAKEAIFSGMPPEVPTVLRRLQEAGRCDTEEIKKIIMGKSSLGTVLNASLDIDNIDGIMRTYMHSQGCSLFDEFSLLLKLFTRKDENSPVILDKTNSIIPKWEKKRESLYRKLLDNPCDSAADAMLGRALEKALTSEYFDESCWKKTDFELINDLVNEEKMGKHIQNMKHSQETKSDVKKNLKDIVALVSRLRVGNLYSPIFQLECRKGTGPKVREMNKDYQRKKKIEAKLQQILDEKLRRKSDLILSVPIFWENKALPDEYKVDGPKTRLDVYSERLFEPTDCRKIEKEFRNILEDEIGEGFYFPITDAFTKYKPDLLFRS